MDAPKVAFQVCLLLLVSGILDNLIQAHRHGELIGELRELKPRKLRPRAVDNIVIDKLPNGIVLPTWDLGTMFVPPRVVAHSNSWQPIVSGYRFDLEVVQAYERDGSWIADLKSPSYQSVFPEMRSGDHFIHAGERYFVAAVTSNSVAIWGMNWVRTTLPAPGKAK